LEPAFGISFGFENRIKTRGDPAIWGIMGNYGELWGIMGKSVNRKRMKRKLKIVDGANILYLKGLYIQIIVFKIG